MNDLKILIKASKRIIALSLLLMIIAGCEEDNRKCLKSHIEESCYCVCTAPNIGFPVYERLDKCDLYEDKKV